MSRLLKGLTNRINWRPTPRQRQLVSKWLEYQLNQIVIHEPPEEMTSREYRVVFNELRALHHALQDNDATHQPTRE